MSTPAKFSRLDPGQRRDQILDAANDAVRRARLRGGLDRGHRACGRCHPRARAPLLRRAQRGLHRAARAARRHPRGTLRPPVGRSARARVADTVSRWLDWTEANRTIWLATIAPRRGPRRPRRQTCGRRPRGRAVALLATFHADIAEDSPRLRYALECWTGLNRAATRRWLTGDATREATQELLASTLEHVLRTFGAPRRHAAADLRREPECLLRHQSTSC